MYTADCVLSLSYQMETVDQDVASLYGFSTYVEMCCIVKAVFILLIYNASKNMCCTFVSDIGIFKWFKYSDIKTYLQRTVSHG